MITKQNFLLLVLTLYTCSIIYRSFYTKNLLNFEESKVESQIDLQL